MTDITKKDLLVLTLMTNYLFCDNYRDVLDYASALLEERIDISMLQNRKVQAKLRGLIWDDFLKLKVKLRKLAQWAVVGIVNISKIAQNSTMRVSNNFVTILKQSLRHLKRL